MKSCTQRHAGFRDQCAGEVVEDPDGELRRGQTVVAAMGEMAGPVAGQPGPDLRMADIADAHRHMEENRSVGKVAVLTPGH